MAITVSNLSRSSTGSQFKISGDLTWDSSYTTGGKLLSVNDIGLSRLTNFEIDEQQSGYVFDHAIATGQDSVTVRAYTGGNSAFTPAGTNGTSSVSGTGTFGGTSPVSDLDFVSPAFSGVGLTAAGQAITTTDNQTMTVNQAAGMWLLSATQATPPNLILGNTGVVAAPAVLVVQGSANTDAGAYRIVKALTPLGSVTALSGTAAAQTFTGTAVSGSPATEVPNATNLSTLTCSFEAVGM